MQGGHHRTLTPALRLRRKLISELLYAGVGLPAPLPLGESGASSVKGGSERRGALLGCPLPRGGGAPAPTARVLEWRRHAGRDFGRILLLSGVSPWMGCPMMGSEGPAVQADSTWYSELRVVRPPAIVADLTVPVVRAAVARRAVTASRSIGYAALAATAGPPKSNSSPVTQMRCMITASLRAAATVARFMPRRLATATPQARRRDHLRVRVINADAAS